MLKNKNNDAISKFMAGLAHAQCTDALIQILNIGFTQFSWLFQRKLELQMTYE